MNIHTLKTRCVLILFLALAFSAVPGRAEPADLTEFKTVLGPAADPMLASISAPLKAAADQGRVRVLLFDPQTSGEKLWVDMDDFRLAITSRTNHTFRATLLVVGLEKNQYLLVGQNVRIEIAENPTNGVPFHHFTFDAVKYIDNKPVRGIRFNGDERRPQIREPAMRRLCLY
ncbi:MAG TPA: DUF5597 domain-containing protein [Desulfuromonadaceae bacterium]|nr:DUF5597 domain-containing protein [Desulfuromonadaceae bacterium]